VSLALILIQSGFSSVPPAQELTYKTRNYGLWNGSNFEAIAECDQGHLNAQIQVLIYNNPEAKAAARAANWDVPTVLLNHRDFQREDLDQQIVQTLRQYKGSGDHGRLDATGNTGFN